MTLPKYMGGVDSMEIESQNIVLLTKMSWRLKKNENGFWLQMLKGIYFSSCDFLNIPNGARGSWA